MSNKKEFLEAKKLLDTAENKIRQARMILFSSEIQSKAKQIETTESEDSIQGVFDGEKMLGSDKKEHLVPPNYASKSKLIPGDVLKLTVSDEGRHVYKQIAPTDRKNLIGVLEEVLDGKYQVDVDGKKFQVLLASVTYFKAKPGDKLSIIVPQNGDTEWAAVDNKI